jgi:predicted N-acetyltransferase YhbS
MIIEHPAFSDIPALRSLWKEAFCDPDAFLDLFFSKAFAPERALAVKENGQILAALYWFYCAWEEKQCAYIYAVATKKEHRGKGICHALMAHLHTEMGKKGKGTVLVPADDGLRTFYAQMGYRDFGGMDEKVYRCGDTFVAAEKLSADEYMQKRRALLPHGSILQEGEVLPFLEGMITFFGGENWLLAGGKMEDAWIFPEFLGDIALLPGILNTLEIPFARVCTAGECPFAMYRGTTELQELPRYFAFALD